MSAEANKTIVRRFLEDGVNSGSMAVLDQYVANVSLKQHVLGLRAAFPDFQFTIQEQLANATGDTIVVRVTGQGTHRGEFQGIAPTGQRVRVPGLVIYHVADGKIVDHMSQADTLGLAEKLTRISSLACA